jgi:hypothetical protein
MNNLDKISIQLAEKICKKKFEQSFGDLNQDATDELYMKQINLWREVGETNLSVEEVSELSPIKQALYYMCKDKIKFCMNKLLTAEE